MSDGGRATPPWAQPLWSIPPYGIRAEDVMPLKVRFLRKGRHSPESEGPERGGIDCLCRNRGQRDTGTPLKRVRSNASGGSFSSGEIGLCSQPGKLGWNLFRGARPMDARRGNLTPRPPSSRGQTHPDDPGWVEGAQATPPRSQEVLVLGLRPDRPQRGREALRRHRALARRQSGSELASTGRFSGSRTECAQEGVARLLRRVVRPRAPCPRGHGRPRAGIRGRGPRTARENPQAIAGAATNRPVGRRETAPSLEGKIL